MKKVIHFLLIVSAFSLISLSCKKEDPPQETNPNTLPPLTHEGRNTFGCYIDGELFVANDGPSVVDIPAVSGSFDENSKELRVQGTKYKDGSGYADVITFIVVVNNKESTYEMKVSHDEVRGYDPYNECLYYHSVEDKGYCRIEYLNTQDNIVSGVFGMRLVNSDCDKDTLKNITQGRFDFRY